MAPEPSHPNPFHRYALAAPAHLLDADELHYVRVTPTADAILVDHGSVSLASPVDPPIFAPVAPPDRFDPDDLAAAVQRVCALAAAWLAFDEWEVEQTRRLFLAPQDT